MPKIHPKKQLVTLIFITGILWILFIVGRPAWYHPWCAVQPTPCLPESVNAFDRISLQFGSVFADFLSNIIQNTVAVVLLALPWLWLRGNRKQAVIAAIYVVLGATLNGDLLEFIHGLVQRPRPLVFKNPMEEIRPINYTSFWSGHTSFVAFATLSTHFWVKLFLSERKTLVRLTWGAYWVLTVSVACLRILGGRHYPTDVLTGFLVGSGIAWSLLQWLRPNFMDAAQKNTQSESI